VGQLLQMKLTHRYRRQASSHSSYFAVLGPNHDHHLSIGDMFVKEHAIALVSCVCG